VITAADSRGEYAGHLDSATRRYESSGGMPAEDILDEKVTHDAWRCRHLRPGRLGDV